jgi:hypothetical protein
VQRITVSPSTISSIPSAPWYVIDSSSEARGLHHWYPSIRTTTCGLILNGASFHGGYATWGAGTAVAKSLPIPYDADVDVETAAVRLSFDVVYIDDWQGEEISLIVASQKIWSRSHRSSKTNLVIDLLENYCGLSQYSDSTYSATVVVPLSDLVEGNGDLFPKYLNITFETSLPIVMNDDDNPNPFTYRGSDKVSWGIKVTTLKMIPNYSIYKSSYVLNFPKHDQGNLPKNQFMFL